MNHKVGNKIIRYSIVSGVVRTLDVFEIESVEDKVIKLNNKTVLYKRTLKERTHINNLHLSRRACQKINKDRVFYRYETYSKDRYDELFDRLEVSDGY